MAKRPALPQFSPNILDEFEGLSDEKKRHLFQLAATSSSDAQKELKRLCVEYLTSGEARWPKAFEWRNYFKHIGFTPYMWRSNEEDDFSPDLLGEIFAHTAKMQHHTRDELAGYKRGARIGDILGNEGCPICDARRGKDVPATIRNMPPFHPGCTCDAIIDGEDRDVDDSTNKALPLKNKAQEVLPTSKQGCAMLILPFTTLGSIIIYWLSA